MEPLTEVQARAAAGLARGRTYQAVADAVGVNRSTVVRWAAGDAFKAAVERLRAARAGEPSSARDVLVTALAARTDDGIDWKTRVQAALKLIEMGEPEANDERPQVVGYVKTYDDEGHETSREAVRR